MGTHRRARLRTSSTALVCAASVSGLASCHLLFGYDDFVDRGVGGHGGSGEATSATGSASQGTRSHASGSGVQDASATTSASTGDGSSASGGLCAVDGVCDAARGESCGNCADDCGCSADQRCTALGCELGDGARCTASAPCASDACCFCTVGGSSCVHQASDCTSPGCFMLQ